MPERRNFPNLFPRASPRAFAQAAAPANSAIPAKSNCFKEADRIEAAFPKLVCLCGHRTRNLLDREGYRELGCVAEGPSSPRAGVEIELTKNVEFILMAVGDDDAPGATAADRGVTV